ncbi:MAG: hypothetical protein OXI02_03750, partial [Candidatus Dadabacteria bacterium]|nr:hypothetical protein [Candidatus Dadabacteria bacterium]
MVSISVSRSRNRFRRGSSTNLLGTVIGAILFFFLLTIKPPVAYLMGNGRYIIQAKKRGRITVKVSLLFLTHQEPSVSRH